MHTPPISVLLIESNPEYARRIETMISDTMGENATLSWCKTRGEGLAFLQDDEYDVVLLSLPLSGRPGIETFHTFFKNPYGVPVVVLSSTDDENMALAAVDGGAHDYLLNGEIKPGALEHSIRSAARRHCIEKKRGQSNRDIRPCFLPSRCPRYSGERPATTFF